jgi:osmotically-inducible protein OsmY
MNEDQVREAIVAELARQAEASPSTLQVETAEERVTVNGEIDLDALAMAIIGSMAGGP